jgi:hypothetical protein
MQIGYQHSQATLGSSVEYMENTKGTKVKRTKFRETFAVQKLSPGHKTHTYFDSQKTQIHRTQIQVHSAIVVAKKKKKLERIGPCQGKESTIDTSSFILQLDPICASFNLKKKTSKSTIGIQVSP